MSKWVDAYMGIWVKEWMSEKVDETLCKEKQVRTHKDLEIWKKGIALVEKIYKLTSIFPKEESYGIISQMRRAAISCPSNIAEGTERSSRKEFVQLRYSKE